MTSLLCAPYQCPVHDENAVLFSPANESLLCITCFRYLPPEIRANCLDLGKTLLILHHNIENVCAS